MIFYTLISIALIAALTAIFAKRVWLFVTSLSVLAAVFAACFLLLILALGDLSAHHDSADWPRPLALAFYFFIAYAAIVFLAFLRRAKNVL